jgi:hypothetical protein
LVILATPAQLVLKHLAALVKLAPWVIPATQDRKVLMVPQDYKDSPVLLGPQAILVPMDLLAELARQVPWVPRVKPVEPATQDAPAGLAEQDVPAPPE